MEQRPSWEANRFSASQETPHTLWSPKVHYFSHKCRYKRGLLFDCFATWYVFYGEELLAPRPTPKLQDHPLSAVCDCLFNIFTATLHIGGRSSIRNLRTRHAVVTGTHLSRKVCIPTAAKCTLIDIHRFWTNPSINTKFACFQASATK